MADRKIVIVAMVLAAAGIVAVGCRQASVTITGVVLREDSDPRKQLPIADVRLSAHVGETTIDGVSDASGLFRLTLPDGSSRGRQISLRLTRTGYQPVEIEPESDGRLYVIRMAALPQPPAPISPHAATIKDVRVRYSEKSSMSIDVGSVAKTFTVGNVGNVPCANKPPCSPGGAWKASVGGITLDAGEGQQFRNARVSCIAGPCPFTRIETGATPAPGRTITVRVTDWSDTVTFLVEAEVSRDMPSDAVRQAYPAIYGRSMSFTLPASAEGPSIEADVNGAEIVFPLGPALQLSWAECTLQQAADRTKLYRCELKPGYDFQ